MLRSSANFQARISKCEFPSENFQAQISSLADSRLHHLDNAATAQMPEVVLGALHRFEVGRALTFTKACIGSHAGPLNLVIRRFAEACRTPSRTQA